jgi:hypothetical protein
MKRFQRMYSLPGLEFAAYLPFDAICWVTFIDDTDVSDKPIREFHGAADDYAPLASCRAYFVLNGSREAARMSSSPNTLAYIMFSIT